MTRIVVSIGLLLIASSCFGQGKGGGAGMGRPMPGPTGHPRADSTRQNGSGKIRDAGTHDTSGKSAVEHLDRNPDQVARIRQLLPAGTDVRLAAQGFKNYGQFVAAAHVSHNLGIPFDHLKVRMIGPDSRSLGDAIHNLRPDLPNERVRIVVKDAQRAAKDSRRS